MQVRLATFVAQRLLRSRGTTRRRRDATWMRWASTPNICYGGTYRLTTPGAHTTAGKTLRATGHMQWGSCSLIIGWNWSRLLVQRMGVAQIGM